MCHLQKLRGKYLGIAFGPLPPENFTIAPVFYVCQLDIFGPCHVYVPGHSMNLRNKKVWSQDAMSRDLLVQSAMC